MQSKKRIYIIIEENGGKPQKYIYVLIITYGAKKKMKLIAKTQKGLEFMHSRNDTFFAPNSSAQKMCDILNKNKYHINNDSETWLVYDYDISQDLYCFRKLSLYRGSLKARYI